MTDAIVSRTSPVVRRVHAYFAPVARAAETPAMFDAVANERFDVTAPPAPWLDLGRVHAFKRISGTKVDALRTGSPAVTAMQVRTEIDATLQFEFETWGKLQMSLACGTQQMNLLKPAAAVALGAGSTASVLQVDAAAGGFSAGDVVAVDVDYAGQTGYIGSGVSAAYVRTALSDVDYVRRVTLNVARVASIVGGAITLTAPLPAGAPIDGMKVSAAVGYCDRDGSSFFQEWSGLFVMDGQQGERIVLFYPRLQTMAGAAESGTSNDGFETVRLAAAFRALPVRDAVDGEQVVCYRSYLPG